MASGRVIFWTTASLEPQYEAVSKEVYALARHFPGSMICSISPHCSIRLLRDPPAIGLHPSFDLPLRALVPFAERCIAVNHVYAEFAPWTYVRTLRRKPTVLTIASEKGAPDEGFLQRVNAIAVQTVGMYERLARQPIWGNKVSLVFPGVDIRRFRKRERRVGTGPTGPRILFATFPRSRDEFEERGVNFLIEAARRLPWLQLTLIGRPWLSGDTASEALRGRLDLERPTNIDFVTAGVLDMAEVHASHDFVVVPYKSPGGRKGVSPEHGGGDGKRAAGADFRGGTLRGIRELASMRRGLRVRRRGLR